MLRLGLREGVRWAGRVRLVRRNLEGRVLWVAHLPNLIVDVGLDLLVEALRDATFDGKIKYLAWGTDSTPPAAGDTTLVAEAGRKAVTTQVAGGTGETVTTVYLGPQDANVAIEELGWFAGPTATAAADSGVLVARMLYSHSKSNLESIQVERTDTLAAA